MKKFMTDTKFLKVEEKIIDWIAKNAGGRLVIFKPEKSDKNLVIEKRDDYKKKTISLKIFRVESANDGDKEILKYLEEKDFIPEENFYLLFAIFDIVKQDINNIIVIIPSLILDERIAVDKKDLSQFFIETLDIIK